MCNEVDAVYKEVREIYKNVQCFTKKGVQGVKGGARQNLARDGLGGHVVGGDLPMTGNVMLHIYWRSGSISFSRSGNTDT